MSLSKRIFFFIFIIVLSGCAATNKNDNKASNLTVGNVQKEIKVGMSQADVLSALGSPNMVSTDEKKREVWVYDKVSTTHMSSSSSGWVFGVIAGINGSASSSSTNQKNLTIIIKFDNDGLVRDFAYHSSQF